eukprot:gene1065-1130_t
MERSRRTKVSKFDLSELQDAREKGVSRLDQLELDDDDAVYDVVDEDKYAQIVEERRKGGDFVVDDDGLGYYDDGEEVLGIAEEGFDGKKRLSDTKADNSISRKARKLAEDSSAQRNTILKHVQPGVSSFMPRPVIKEKTAPSLLDIDALLEGNKSSGAKSGISLLPGGIRPPRFQSRRPMVQLPSFRDIPLTPEVYEGHDIAHDPNENVMEVEVSQSPEVSDIQENVSGEVVKEEVQKISLTKTTKRLRVSAPIVTPKVEVQPDKFQAATIQDNAAANMPAFVEAEFAPTQSAETASRIDPALFMRTDPTDPQESLVDMFWIDATEINGDLFLFGKILVGKKEDSVHQKKFVSACIQVTGCERNLFVLPKAIPGEFNADGSPRTFPPMEIYKEIHELLLKLPDQKHGNSGGGQLFKCKPVKRKYAFEHGDVPRQETEYLKVVYSSKRGIPSIEQCANGRTYARIFGTSSNALELFLLKRGLMGPCWITIKNAKLVNEPKSWCKLELTVDNPKLVKRYGAAEKMKKTSAGTETAGKVKEEVAPLPVPPVTTLAFSIRTAVNPSTHVHEIIAISGVIHTRVALEADTEVNTSMMKRFTFVRQLGMSCGPNYAQSFPHDIQMEVKKHQEMAIQTFPNERALLSMFFVKMQQEDPDIFVSHNLLGFEMDVVLNRAVANKIPNWSLLGRLRKAKPPKSISERDSFSGRLMCDTYKAAKEFLRETNYGLTSLAASQLKVYDRQEIDPIDVPKYFSTAQDVASLCFHTYRDAWMVFQLMLKLQVIPLTKQLTCLSGNLWSRTMRGARAERIEYLLLHEFHAQKFILPEKKLSEFAQNGANNKKKQHQMNEEDGDGDEDQQLKVGGLSRKRAKAAYVGGLVLEPKKGLYDSYILLLDFNSLYPSIIQEYNLCFTTVNWPQYMGNSAANNTVASLENKGGKTKKNKTKKDENGEKDGEYVSDDEDESDEEDGNGESPLNNGIPPLPDTSTPGILPRVIKTLVDRRREVKRLLKDEKSAAKRQELDIRQKALKLTANSMYGCLGFSFSRFYARPIAALVTAKGREALQKTVDLATRQMSLDVIYGDTDSVMINTNCQDLAMVKSIGMKVKAAVNQNYKSLELDLDGIFRSMLLLKKKKYAALVVHEQPDGTVAYEKEMKGLDLVRRDWCELSKETGRYVVDQILSGKPCEEIVESIHDHLSDLATQIRSGALPLEQFIITKGLNKNPKDYPDSHGQAHLQVAMQMIKENKPVNIGDHIPYVICTQGAEGATAVQRAYHPDNIRREPEKFTIDFEWYISNQILPPISRLCEPIQGTSQLILSEKLGLDLTKYGNRSSGNTDDLLDDWGFTPKCLMDDQERFKGCTPLTARCGECEEMVEVQCLLDFQSFNVFSCPKCKTKLLGKGDAFSCYALLSNRLTLAIRENVKRYYDCYLVCDDPSCAKRTMQISLKGLSCLERGCRGRLKQEYDEFALYNQLKYFEALFDVPHYVAKKGLAKDEIKSMATFDELHVLHLLKEHMTNTIKWSAYNWIRPSLWSSLFGKALNAGKSNN